MPRFNASATAEEVTEGLNLKGRRYLVTGCNSGLGRETMRVLALRGAQVLGAARTQEKAAAACAEVGGDAAPLACDLSDPASVRAAVRAVQEPLNGVIANAGVMGLPKLSFVHGVEAHMFTNHVGHFMLVTGLLDRLTANGRVVVLSSGAHRNARGEVTFGDLGWDRTYTPFLAYGHSKLANILFAKELARRLPAGQTANAVHPGIIQTRLSRHLSPEENERMASSSTLRTVPEGAATQVFVATHPSAAKESGAYFGDCAPRRPSALARDGALAARLWETTERLVEGL